MSGVYGRMLAIPNRARSGALPTYQRNGQVYAPGAGVSARLSDAGGRLAGEAAQESARGLVNLAKAADKAVQVGINAYEDYQVARAKDAFNKYQQEEMELRARLNTLKGQNALGDEGVEAQLGRWRTGARQRFAEELGINSVASLMFGRAADRQDAETDAWAIGKVDRERTAYANGVDEAAIINAINKAMQDPMNHAAVGEAVGTIRATYESMARRNGWDASYRDAKFGEARQKMFGEMITNAIQAEDLGTARSLLKIHGADLGGLKGTLEARIQAKGRELESRARARQAEARLDISARIQDSMAAWGQGQEAPTAPTRAEVMAAYGEKGEAVWREVEAGRQYGADMQAIGTMTSEQQRQLLEERKPVPGEGYADAMKRYALLEEAVQKDNKLRKEDPGAYLVLRDAGVKSALDAFSKASTPENATAYARAVRAGMEARGMEFDAGTPLLPKSQAEALAGNIVRSEDPAGQLVGLQQTFGKDWPAVERQIMQGRKLPSAMRVMAGGMETEDGRLLMDSYRNKDFTKQSEASLNIKEADVRVTVRGKLEDMLLTVRAQGDLSMDAALVDSATRLTMTYMQRGDDMDDAVSKAVQAVGGDRYSYRDSYRVPVTLDADKVAYGARRTLRDVALGDTLTTPRAVSLPQGYVDESFAATVRREGTWVTMPDESGLQLFVLGRPVRDKDGKPIVKTWDELTAVGGDAPSGYENFQDWQRAWEEE